MNCCYSLVNNFIFTLTAPYNVGKNCLNDDKIYKKNLNIILENITSIFKKIEYKKTPQNQKTISDLPNEILIAIFSETDNPRLTEQVCKEWKNITHTFHYPSLLDKLEKELGKKFIEVIPLETEQLVNCIKAVYRKAFLNNQEKLTEKDKCKILLQHQQQRIFHLFNSEILTKKCLKSLNIDKEFNLIKFKEIQQWIKDFNIIQIFAYLDRSKISEVEQKIINDNFDFVEIADKLRLLLNGQYQNVQKFHQPKWFSLTTLPSEIGYLSHLTSLNLSYNKIIDISPAIGDLSHLNSLKLLCNRVIHLPSEIGKLSRLTSLKLQNNRLTEIPLTIGDLSQLTLLDLSSNRMIHLPSEIGKLSSLKYLNLRNNMLIEIPSTISNLSRLKVLAIAENHVIDLPEKIYNNLPRLKNDLISDLQRNKRCLSSYLEES